MASLRGTGPQTVFVKNKAEAQKIYKSIVNPTNNQKRQTVDKIKKAFEKLNK